MGLLHCWDHPRSQGGKEGRGGYSVYLLDPHPHQGGFLQSPLNSGHFGWFQVWTERSCGAKPIMYVWELSSFVACPPKHKSPGLGRASSSRTRVPNGETVFPTENHTLGTHCAHKGTQLASTHDPNQEPLLWRQMPLGCCLTWMPSIVELR